jgi:hypothetical protein
MTRLISKLPGLRSRTEAEKDLQDADPLPVIIKGVVVLLLGDIALTLVAIVSSG